MSRIEWTEENIKEDSQELSAKRWAHAEEKQLETKNLELLPVYYS